MECPVCLSAFDVGLLTPQIFPCGHTVCLSCVNNIYDSETLICPIDRHPLPEKSVIRPNYALLDLIQKGAKQEDILTCCNGHRLQDLINAKGRCEICRKDRSPLWFCMSCQNGVCSVCKDWFSSSSMIREPSVKCFNGHSLRYTQNPGVFYKKEGKFLCDGCKVIVDGSSGHCRVCSVDYCALCLRKLIELVNQRLFIPCSCHRQVVWRANEVCGKCSVCRERFDKSGSFKCISCNRTSCLVCTYKSN